MANRQNPNHPPMGYPHGPQPPQMMGMTPSPADASSSAPFHQFYGAAPPHGASHQHPGFVHPQQHYPIHPMHASAPGHPHSLPNQFSAPQFPPQPQPQQQYHAPHPQHAHLHHSSHPPQQHQSKPAGPPPQQQQQHIITEDDEDEDDDGMSTASLWQEILRLRGENAQLRSAFQTTHVRIQSLEHHCDFLRFQLLIANEKRLQIINNDFADIAFQHAFLNSDFGIAVADPFTGNIILANSNFLAAIGELMPEESKKQDAPFISELEDDLISLDTSKLEAGSSSRNQQKKAASGASFVRERIMDGAEAAAALSSADPDTLEETEAARKRLNSFYDVVFSLEGTEFAHLCPPRNGSSSSSSSAVPVVEPAAAAPSASALSVISSASSMRESVQLMAADLQNPPREISSLMERMMAHQQSSSASAEGEVLDEDGQEDDRSGKRPSKRARKEQPSSQQTPSLAAMVADELSASSSGAQPQLSVAARSDRLKAVTKQLRFTNLRNESVEATAWISRCYDKQGQVRFLVAHVLPSTSDGAAAIAAGASALATVSSSSSSS